MYFKFKSPSGIDFILNKNNDENIFIPINNDNVDYKKYLDWVAEGNEPEPWES